MTIRAGWISAYDTCFTFFRGAWRPAAFATKISMIFREPVVPHGLGVSFFGLTFTTEFACMTTFHADVTPYL